MIVETKISPKLYTPSVCVYYCRTYYKDVREGGGGCGGHVLRETTSRGLCELVCPSRTKDPRAYRRELDTVTQAHRKVVVGVYPKQKL